MTVVDLCVSLGSPLILHHHLNGEWGAVALDMEHVASIVDRLRPGRVACDLGADGPTANAAVNLLGKTLSSHVRGRHKGIPTPWRRTPLLDTWDMDLGNVPPVIILTPRNLKLLSGPQLMIKLVDGHDKHNGVALYRPLGEPKDIWISYGRKGARLHDTDLDPGHQRAAENASPDIGALIKFIQSANPASLAPVLRHISGNRAAWLIAAGRNGDDFTWEDYRGQGCPPTIPDFDF